MDVDISSVRVHVAATIEAGLEALEPKYSVSDRRSRMPLPRQTGRLPAAKHRADGPAAANLFRDAMQAKRSLVGSFLLADAETRRGNAVSIPNAILWKSPDAASSGNAFEQQQDLFADTCHQNEPPWTNALFSARDPK